jgi:hypothetical protein
MILLPFPNFFYYKTAVHNAANKKIDKIVYIIMCTDIILLHAYAEASQQIDENVVLKQSQVSRFKRA